MKLALFDIDGTLLWSDGAGRAAIRAALLAECGRTGPIDGYRFDGKTDQQIVGDLLSASGSAETDLASRIDAVCQRYLGLLEEELARRRLTVQPLPGAAALLDQLERRHDVVLGLLTGNLAEGARLKLTAAGIDPSRFRVGAYGSDAAARSALPGIAAGRARTILGREPVDEEMVILGDTPADVTCGASRRARALGVATGSFSAEELRAAGAYRVFDDLTDAAAVIDAIVA